MPRSNKSKVDTSLELPDPYGHGFERIEDPLENTRIQWAKLENRRKVIGNFARNRVLLLWRSIVGLTISFIAILGILFPEQISQTSYLLLILPLPVALAVLPNIIAVESAWHAMQARLSLREQGGISDGRKRTLRVQPGMDRILDSVRDHRRNNLISTVSLSASLSLLFLAYATQSGTIVWNLALIVSMTSGFLYTFHAQYTRISVRQLGDKFANLVFHAPTHHQTQLGSILGDLVAAHLDPDLELEWAAWKNDFFKSLMPGYDKHQALERLLYVLYLHQLGEIDTEGAKREFTIFIKKGKQDDIILNDEKLFNWRTIQRLISHAKGWQPSAFNLIDRLQIDLLSSRPEVSRARWRMDVALDDICVDGSTNLFISLNNQTFNKEQVTVEVLVPNGEPETRTHRFDLESCPPPRDTLKLSSSKEEDILDWLPRYLHKGVVLWMNVAWNRKFSGDTTIQVILRDRNNVVIQSRVLTTTVSKKSSNLVRKRMMRLEKARAIGELKVPI